MLWYLSLLVLVIAFFPTSFLTGRALLLVVRAWSFVRRTPENTAAAILFGNGLWSLVSALLSATGLAAAWVVSGVAIAAGGLLVLSLLPRRSRVAVLATPRLPRHLG